jgi:ribonuclease HI
MELKIYTDGGSLNNPGPAASAYVIYQDNKILVKHGKKIGDNTNNFAEYTALILALEKVKELLKNLKDIDKISVFSDSSLMVNQLNGFFKVKNGTIRELIMKVRILEREINIPIIYKHIPREENTLADSLVKKELL